MREHRIGFCLDMLRLVNDGRKTQTRRIIRPQPEPPGPSRAAYISEERAWVFGNNSGKMVRCPYGVPGDTLCVREPWYTLAKWDGLAPSDLPWEARSERRVAYAIDGPPPDGYGRKRNALHMPHWAARTRLTVTDVRVERVQHISEEDALAEGVIRIGFKHLWDSINASRGYGWTANPWVWAITFTRDTSGRVAQ